MRSVGILRKWDDVRGFGFIRPTGGQHDVFLHATTVKACQVKGTVTEGQKFEFDIEPGQAGHPGGRAANIARAE